MSARQPRFEVVHSGPRCFFGRFIAANGKEVWRTSETYKRRRDAHQAVLLLARHAGWFDVREVDEVLLWGLGVWLVRS